LNHFFKYFIDMAKLLSFVPFIAVFSARTIAGEAW
jgi:hypothetical protein